MLDLLDISICFGSWLSSVFIHSTVPSPRLESEFAQLYPQKSPLKPNQVSPPFPLRPLPLALRSLLISQTHNGFDQQMKEVLSTQEKRCSFTLCSFPLQNGPFAKWLHISPAICSNPNFHPSSAGKPLLVVVCQMATKSRGACATPPGGPQAVWGSFQGLGWSDLWLLWARIALLSEDWVI